MHTIEKINETSAKIVHENTIVQRHEEVVDIDVLIQRKADIIADFNLKAEQTKDSLKKIDEMIELLRNSGLTSKKDVIEKKSREKLIEL